MTLELVKTAYIHADYSTGFQPQIVHYGLPNYPHYEYTNSVQNVLVPSLQT